MIRIGLLLVSLAVVSCGPRGVDQNAQQILVDVRGMPVTVFWNAAQPDDAVARFTSDVTLQPANLSYDDMYGAIERATGCAIDQNSDVRVIDFQNGDRGIGRGVDCSSRAEPGTDAALLAGPNIYRTVIEAEGYPVEIAWDRVDRSRAQARMFGFSEGVAIDPTGLVEQATGCRAVSAPEPVAVSDGVPTYFVGTDCSPGRAKSTAEAEQSAKLAREIDMALNEVAAEPAAAVAPAAVTGVPATAAPVLAQSLFEGSAYSAFTPADIQRYCGEPWETRIGEGGRTEYNPCKRRDAFR